jgi:hypothetical protein
LSRRSSGRTLGCATAGVIAYAMLRAARDEYPQSNLTVRHRDEELPDLSP